MGAKFDGLEAKVDAQGADLKARIEEGDRCTRDSWMPGSPMSTRLSNVENDLRIVKAHLIGQQSA